MDKILEVNGLKIYPNPDSIAWGLGPILFARISPDDKEKILGGNLRRILSKYSL